jgi:hypothetical protein
MQTSSLAGRAPALRALALLFAAALAAAPVAAESIASSASSAGSASVGSLSESIGGSSDASSGRQTADAGTYRVLAVAPLDGGRQRLTLRSEAEPRREFTLTLPLAAATLQPGARIAVQARPYGLAFAHAGASAGAAPGAPFYLALADDWRHDLDLRRVAL